MAQSIRRLAGRMFQVLGLLGIVVGAYDISRQAVDQPGAEGTDRVPTLLLVGALLFLLGTLLERRAPG